MSSNRGGVCPQYVTQALGMRILRRGITSIVCLLLLLGSVAPALARAPIRIGVWTLNGEADAMAQWDDTAIYLSKKLPKHSFEIVPLNYEQLVGAIKRREIGFAIIDPALYVQLEAGKHVENIATAQDTYSDVNYTASAGTVLCKTDRDELHTALDLKGKHLVTTDPRDLAGWLSCLREYKRLRFQPSHDLQSLQFRGNDEDAIAAVLEDQADAAAVSAGALERLTAEKKIPEGALKVLLFPDASHLSSGLRMPLASSTRPYPDWCFASVKRTDPGLTKQVAATLLTMPSDRPALQGAPRHSGWVPPRPNICTHECLQELRMFPYEEYGKESATDFVREHMYWFIAAAVLFLLLVAIDLYVMALNRALSAEIDERKAAEIALRESILRFEHVASCSADWIWETDSEGHYTYSSSIVHQMLGYDAAEVVGKCPFDLFATAEKERLRAEGQPAITTGKRIFRERYRMLTKDGRVVIHESTAEPVYNEQGELVGYRGVNRDITDQVRFVRLRL